MKDFQGDDQRVAEHKKPEYFRQAQQQESGSQSF
jgi:hypothetical protein